MKIAERIKLFRKSRDPLHQALVLGARWGEKADSDDVAYIKAVVVAHFSVKL